MKRTLRKVDRELKKMEFQVKVELGNFILALTDKAVGNHKLLDLGVCGQQITVRKEGQCLKANIFGITIDTYYSFEQISAFGTLLSDSV